MTDTDGNGLRLQAGFLGDDDKQAIYDAALEVIGTVGMRVRQPAALELLRGAGAEVVGDDLVRLPARLVERARSTAPAVVPVFDRDGEPAMRLGGRRSYFGTGSDLMNVYDLESGERRLARLDDVTAAARLCDALSNIDFVMSSAYPSDVADPHRAYVHEFRAMVNGTTKPMVVTAEGVDDLEVMWQIAAELRGGAAALAVKPYFVMYGQPSSPLAHPRDSLDKLLFCADKGIPAIYSPAPLAGATAPITVAGHIAQGVAESLFGLVIHQLRQPGAPFLFGIGPAVLDMATAQSSYNAPEYLMSYLGAIEMARWLDLPNWGYGGTSDAQLVDAQAGMEAGELTLLSMMAGSNLNHDVGYLDYRHDRGVRADRDRRRVRRHEPPTAGRHHGRPRDARPRRDRPDRSGRRLSVDQAHGQAPAHGAVAADHHQSQGLRALVGRRRRRPARAGAAQGAAPARGARRRRRSPPTLASRIDALVEGFSPAD